MAYAPPSYDGRPPALFLNPSSPEFGAIADDLALRNGIPATSAWPSANKPVAMPFWLAEPITVYQLGWYNGASALSVNADVGIYDASWNRRVSTGSTAMATSSALQFVDIADTVVPAGKSYLVMAISNTTAGQIMSWPGVNTAIAWSMFGLMDSGTNAFALPDPLTNMVASATFITVPACYMALRTLV